MKGFFDIGDLKVAIVLLLFSPLVLLAAAGTLLFWSVWIMLSRVNLPTPLSGIVAVVTMCIAFPFLAIAQPAALGLHFLLRERVGVDGSQISITSWRGREYYSWSAIQSVTKELQAPMGSFCRLGLCDGTTITLSAFADTHALVTQAERLGYVVADKAPKFKAQGNANEAA